MKTPRFWQTENTLSTLLRPLSCLYHAGAWADRRFAVPQRASVPVISIGNLTAGGAGKTPTTLALVPLLRAFGHTPHIITRGYRGANLTAHRVREDDDWRDVGDEALLLAQAAPTWVGRDRIASAHAATTAGASILVCDDALQHHKLHKDISLLVIDGPYGIGNGQLLPAGPLREPFARALARTDAVLLIGEDAQHLSDRLLAPVFAGQLQPSADIAFLQQHEWVAFAGIGRPEKFYATLRAHGARLATTRDFPDHHAYSTSDIDALAALAVRHRAHLITTAKDAVKFPVGSRRDIAVLPVTLTMDSPATLSHFLAERLARIGTA